MVLGPSVDKIIGSGTREDNNASRAYLFDYVFDPRCNQNTVFTKVGKPILEKVVNGNCGVTLSFGPRESGKTQSLFGGLDEARGIIPRAMDYIFAFLEKKGDDKAVVLMSVFDICKDGARDLLAKPNKDTNKLPGPQPVADESDNPKMLVPIKGIVATQIKSTSQGTNLLEKILATRTPFKKAGSAKFTINKNNTNSDGLNFSSLGVAISVVMQDQRLGETIGNFLALDCPSSCAREFTQEGKRKLGMEVDAATSITELGKFLSSINVDKTAAPDSVKSCNLTRVLRPYLTTGIGTLLVHGDDKACQDDTIDALRFGHYSISSQEPERMEKLPDDPQFNKVVAKVEALRKQLATQKESYERKIRVLGSKQVNLGDDFDEDISNGKDDTDHEGNHIKALSQIKSLQRRLAKKDTEITKLKDKQKEDRDEFLHLLSNYRKERVTLQDSIKQEHQNLKNNEVVFTASRKKDLAAISSRDASMVASQNQRVKAVSDAFFIEKGGSRLLLEQKESLNVQVEKERREFKIAKDKEVANLKEQFQFYLKEKDDVLKKFVGEFEEYKKEKTEEVNSFVGELTIVYDYMAKLTQICYAVDNGLYPLQEKNGVSRLVIRPQEKDTLQRVDEMRIRRLRTRLRKVDKFTQRFKGGMSANKWMEKEIRAIEEMSVEELRHEVVNSRRGENKDTPQGVGAEEIELMRERVLDELSSENTVQYIKQLEEERDFYKKFARDEAKKRNGLRIAFRSQSRLLGKELGGQRPESANGYVGHPTHPRAATAPTRPSTSPNLGKSFGLANFGTRGLARAM